MLIKNMQAQCAQCGAAKRQKQDLGTESAMSRERVQSRADKVQKNDAKMNRFRIFSITLKINQG